MKNTRIPIDETRRMGFSTEPGSINFANVSLKKSRKNQTQNCNSQTVGRSTQNENCTTSITNIIKFTRFYMQNRWQTSTETYL